MTMILATDRHRNTWTIFIKQHGRIVCKMDPSSAQTQTKDNGGGVKFAFKMMNFAFKMMNFAYKMMNFAYKMMNFAYKMMKFAFKMMN